MFLILLWKHNQRIDWSRLKRSVAKKSRSDLFQGSCFCAGEGRSKGKVLYCFGEVQAFSSIKKKNYFAIESYWRNVSWFYYDWFKRRFKTASKSSYLISSFSLSSKAKYLEPKCQIFERQDLESWKRNPLVLGMFFFIIAGFFCICRVFFADGDWEVEPARRGERLRWCGGGADVLHPARPACHCCRPHPCCVSFQSHFSFRLWSGFGFCFFSRLWLWYLKM